MSACAGRPMGDKTREVLRRTLDVWRDGRLAELAAERDRKLAEVRRLRSAVFLRPGAVQLRLWDTREVGR